MANWMFISINLIRCDLNPAFSLSQRKKCMFSKSLADLSYSNLYYVHNMLFWKEKLDLIVILGAVCEVEPNYFTFPPHLHRPALYFILYTLYCYPYTLYLIYTFCFAIYTFTNNVYLILYCFEVCAMWIVWSMTFGFWQPVI